MFLKFIVAVHYLLNTLETHFINFIFCYAQIQHSELVQFI